VTGSHAKQVLRERERKKEGGLAPTRTREEDCCTVSYTYALSPRSLSTSNAHTPSTLHRYHHCCIIVMAPTTRPDYKLNLEGLPQLNMGGSRSANGSATNSPIEPAGSGLRYPLGNGLGQAGAQLGSGRAGAGSPSKEYGSRLFPKRWVSPSDCVLPTTCSSLTMIQRTRDSGPRRYLTFALGTTTCRQRPLHTSP
jgi:hypothetical protein